MILSEAEINERMNSPLNLLNRLKAVTSKPNSGAMDIFMPPRIDDLIESAEDKIRLASSRTKALEVIDDAVKALHQRLDEVDKPKDLSKIATDMARVVSTVNDVKNGNNNNSGKQLVIWQPVIVQENHYETITVND